MISTVGQSELVSRATRLLQAGNPRESLNICRHLAEQNSADPEVLFSAGILAGRAGDLNLAESLLSQALAIQPDSPNILYNLGLVYRDQGQLEQAIAVLSKAVSVKPDFAIAHFDLGILLRTTGRHQQAIEAYQQAIRHDPNCLKAYYNLAVSLKNEGRNDEAVSVLLAALARFPGEINILNNLGLAYHSLGRPEKAVDCYDQALAVQPDTAELYYNRGNSYYQAGKFELAINDYRQALQLRPQYGEACINLGIALKGIWLPEEAETLLEAGITLCPKAADGHFNLGVLLSQKRPESALQCFRRAIALDEGNPLYRQHMASCLQHLSPVLLDVSCEKDLLDCLTFPGINKASLSKPSLFVLKNRADFGGLLKIAASGRIVEQAKEILAGKFSFLLSPLLQLVLRETILTDESFETVLSGIRKMFLTLAVDGGISVEYQDRWLEFVCCLACQCFANEYVFTQMAAEDEMVKALRQGLESTAPASEQSLVFQLAVLATYLPLWQLGDSEKLAGIRNSGGQMYCHLVRRQLFEPLAEKRIIDNIRCLTTVSDTVSAAVRSQYEENPYPRWLEIDFDSGPQPPVRFLRQLYPHFSWNTVVGLSDPEVLIAGCGTGRHAIYAARKYAGSRILALDLSRSSLAYGIRKAEELGVDNIDFIQGDILAVEDLGRSFDIIECSGVLHHMAAPEAGWRKLVNCLKPGGFIKIALYSELARQSVVAVRRFISQNGYGTTPADIRRCRQAIYDLPPGRPEKRVIEFSDFFTLSQFRDLVFHVQEHRFTIPRIAAVVHRLNLDFLGFMYHDPGTVVKYKKRFPGDSAGIHFDSLHQFETENPDTFLAMYQFWCYKRSSDKAQSGG